MTTPMTPSSGAPAPWEVVPAGVRRPLGTGRRAPGAGTVVVRPEFVDLGGGELDRLTGPEPGHPPAGAGHPWSGTVLAVGAAVHDLTVGQVAVGRGDLGFGIGGTLAGELTVAAADCGGVPAGITARRAATVQPLAAALGGLQAAGGADASQVAIVLGCGTVGLAMVGLLARTGATVVAVDADRQRRAVAAGLGAEFVGDATDGPALRQEIDIALGTVGSAGADLVVVSAPPTATWSAALDVSIDVALTGARVLVPHGAPAESFGRLGERRLAVTTFPQAHAEARDRALRLLTRLQLDLSTVTGDVLSVAECQEALAAARGPRRPGRVPVRSPGRD
ncbi:MDR/zinc-dependent alcohol dehydrogenase-like family protein [Nakamurella leprariae]|uniref:Zinc-binding alcohol dehydrogenase n=1 Tax=Nakamurella leprariae TaxID=2803911 RepID=A0A938YHC2_9ACTN|nr:hypothetical protein [Nakamurella leprariae]MBM9467838.1 hypothetical protein [Nakamurella leprariae]